MYVLVVVVVVVGICNVIKVKKISQEKNDVMQHDIYSHGHSKRIVFMYVSFTQDNSIPKMSSTDSQWRFETKTKFKCYLIQNELGNLVLERSKWPSSPPKWPLNNAAATLQLNLKKCVLELVELNMLSKILASLVVQL